MRFEIKVFPRSRRRIVEKREDGLLLVRVSAPAESGRANEEAIKLLAEHFDINKSRLRIVVGSKTRNKILEISN